MDWASVSAISTGFWPYCFQPKRQLPDTSNLSSCEMQLRTMFLENVGVRPPSLSTKLSIFLTERDTFCRLHCLCQAASGTFRLLRMSPSRYTCALQPRYHSSVFTASRSIRPIATIPRPIPQPETPSISSRRPSELHSSAPIRKLSCNL